MIDEFEGKTIADKYRVDKLMRDSDLGGFYSCWHVLMDKPVILKILSPALAIDRRFVDRFLAESKAAAQVSHENILNIADFGTDGRGVNYTVYEGAADRGSMRDLMERDGALGLPQILDIAEQIAAGLAAAHAKGLIHGFLSPEKILISHDDERPEVKIFDFGSQPVGRKAAAALEYSAPEQYADPAAVDARSDVFSLGVIVYEMLAGAVPFKGATPAQLHLKQETEPPPPLSAFRPDLPADLEPMILSAMSVYPDRRYPTMTALAEDLKLVSASIPGAAKSAAVPGAPTGKNIWQTAFIVLAGMSILAAAFIYATSVKKSDPTISLQADAGSLPVQPIGPATGVQEESLAKLPAMTDTEVMSSANMAQPPGTLPGGDGFNAWANGGAPPLGAPPAQYVPPGGQLYTIDPNGGSQFMPPDGGVILVPVPVNTNTAAKPTQTPKTASANAKPLPAPGTTPKPLATPPKTEKPAPAASPAGKPASGKPKVSE